MKPIRSLFMETYNILTIRSVKTCYIQRYPSLGGYISVFFFPIIIRIFLLHVMDKYRGKITHKIIYTPVHLSLCVLNFMLPSGRPNFAQGARNT